MAVLITGEITNLSRESILSTFFDKDVVVLGETVPTRREKGIKYLTLTDYTDIELIFKTYKIDSVVYLSEFLTLTAKGDKEYQRLTVLLEVLKKHREVPFVYVESPILNLGIETNRKILAEAAERLCLVYHRQGKLNLKIVRSLYLYDPDMRHSEMAQMIAQGINPFELKLNPKQPAYIIFDKDLIRLIYRMLDSWTDELDVLSVADQFNVTIESLYRPVGVTLDQQGVFSDDKMPIIYLSADSEPLRQKYQWYPKISVLDELDGSDAAVGDHRLVAPSRWDKFKEILAENSLPTKVVEVLLLFIVSEVLNFTLGQQVYFEVIDYRLLFIVITGLVFGTKFGLFAAVLSSVSLLFNTMLTTRMVFSAIFFDPSNWVAYIAMIIAGVISGMIRERGKDELLILEAQKDMLNQQLLDERDYIEDLVERQSTLTQQIIGRRDSYGKINHYLSMLDTPYRDVFLARAINIVSEVFGTKAVQLYSLNQKGEFTLVAEKSSHEPLTQDKLAHLSVLLTDTAGIKSWVNFQLEDGYPMYVSELSHGEEVYYLAVDQVTPDKLTLYYQNLFKVLTNIFGIQFDYCLSRQSGQVAVGQNLLSEEEFYQKLEAFEQGKFDDLESRLLRIDLSDVKEFNSVLSLPMLLPHINSLDSIGFINDKLYLMTITMGDNQVDLLERFQYLPVTPREITNYNDVFVDGGLY